MAKLFIFDTHPIQYRAPVFAALWKEHPALQVFFFNDQFDGKRWWFHEVDKIPKQSWGLPLQEGYPSVSIGTSDLGFWGSFRRLAQILDREKPTQVGIFGYYLPEHWMIRFLCARRRIPILFVGETFQGGRGSVRKVLKIPLRRFFFAGISRFITIGDKTLRYYRRLGISERRLVAAKYCVDLSFFERTDEEAGLARENWRKRLGIGQDAFVVLFVGRLFERKRPWDLFALQRRLSKDYGDIFSVMVGNGPMEKELESQSAQAPRLLLAGFHDQSRIREAYYGADVLFVPSEFETWGLVVNEAAACGLPAVVSDTCGVAEDLTVNGETGFVYPCGNVDAAMAYIQRLYKDRTILRRLGSNAREKVRAQYGVGQFSNAFLRAMEGVY